jgi:peptidoglycan/LPS O-acetylase OafA/YrhL
LKTYFPALTGVRAVAAFLVFFYHYILHVSADAHSFIFKWLILMAHQGHIGVPIFFVLSGFLITTRYATTIELTGPWLRRYLQNRFARIYPLYFLLTLLTFIVMVSWPTQDWYEWQGPVTFSKKVAIVILNLTLTRSYFQSMQFLGVPTAWTLTVEETFYLCAPFLLIGVKRHIRWIYFYPLLLVSCGVLLVALCSHFLPRASLLPTIEYMLSATFFGRCVEFMVGIGLAFWTASRYSHSQQLHTEKATLLGCLGIMTVVLLLAIIEQTLPEASSAHQYTYALVCYVLLPFPIAVLFWGLTQERTWLQQVLATKTFDLLGKSSYAFYLIHLGVIDTLFNRYVTDNWVVRLVAYTFLSIALYKWVEHPFNKLLRAKMPVVQKQAVLEAA